MSYSDLQMQTGDMINDGITAQRDETLEDAAAGTWNKIPYKTYILDFC